jgi:hypothetical protein
MTDAVQISQVVGLPDVLVDNHFSMFFPILPGGGDTEAFWIRNMTGILPGKSNAVTKVDLHRHTANFANRLKFGHTFQANYLDTGDRKVLKALQLWQKQCTDPQTGLPNPKETYVADPKVIIYGADNNPVETRTFYNLFVSAVSDVPLNGASENAPLIFPVTFTYDMWLSDDE